jgi:hypothetical protein
MKYLSCYICASDVPCNPHPIYGDEDKPVCEGCAIDISEIGEEATKKKMGWREQE